MGMINLSQETEALAQRLAAAQRLSVEATIQRALEAHAHFAGIEQDLSPQSSSHDRRADFAFGSEIAAMPLLDPRSPNEIMDDLNAL